MDQEAEHLVRGAAAHSKFKIEWAKNHINAVEQIVNAIIAENANPISIQTNPETGIATVLIGPKQLIPVNLPLHLGDAIHALNSSMDFLWSGLARIVDPAIANKRVTFPRHETRKQLEDTITHALAKPEKGDGAIHMAFPKAKSFILDHVKPYKRTDDPSFIWHLGKVDNINKHRMLIATPHVIRFEDGLILEGADGSRITHSPETAIRTQGYPLKLGLTPPVKISNDPKPTIGVVFGEPEHFTGEPVVETLVNLVEATSKVVELFEETFLPG